MSAEIRVCQFMRLRTLGDPKRGQPDLTHRYQNYFIKERKQFSGEFYNFAPFQVEGGVSSLNADNEQLRILFPATQYALELLDIASGNRKSRLDLYTRFITASEAISNTTHDNFFIGTGSAYSDETIELRFRSAIGGITQNLPARKLSRYNVGILPLDSQLNLR